MRRCDGTGGSGGLNLDVRLHARASSAVMFFSNFLCALWLRCVADAISVWLARLSP